MPEQLHRQDFFACLHTRFQVLDDYAAAGEAVCELELIEVSEEKRAPRQEMFSVVFCGPMQRFLPQRTYRLRHECLGEQQLFLVPVGQDAEGFQYQAVFNRLSAPPVGPHA
jgi:hypothetical protein